MYFYITDVKDFVEKDLKGKYDGEGFYCKDAFDSLKIMRGL